MTAYPNYPIVQSFKLLRVTPCIQEAQLGCQASQKRAGPSQIWDASGDVGAQRLTNRC
jgi:hypothetical protein